jgi:phospholipid/cholesterol/gamma-HCH transport system substrate-binding protein
MQEMRRNFIVGVFVLAGLIALAVLIILFGRIPAWGAGRQFTLDIRFERATGIREGTQATVGGIEVGRVLGVNFADPRTFEGGVVVRVGFNRAVELHRGTRAATVEPGLGMGRPPIRILPGPHDEPLLESGAVIPGQISSAVEQIIPKEIVSVMSKSATQIGTAAEALTPVLNDLQELLEPRSTEAADRPGGPPGNLSTAVARLDSSLRHFNDVLGDPQVRSHFRESIENLHKITEDGKGMVADLQTGAANFKDVTAQAKELAGQMQTTVGNVDRRVDEVGRAVMQNLDLAAGLFQQMNETATQINNGEGTIGRFVTDPRLYESMVLTFRRLAEATEELRLLIKEWQQGKIRVAL